MFWNIILLLHARYFNYIHSLILKTKTADKKSIKCANSEVTAPDIRSRFPIWLTLAWQVYWQDWNEKEKLRRTRSKQILDCFDNFNSGKICNRIDALIILCIYSIHCGIKIRVTLTGSPQKGRDFHEAGHFPQKGTYKIGRKCSWGVTEWCFVKTCTLKNAIVQ